MSFQRVDHTANVGCTSLWGYTTGPMVKTGIIKELGTNGFPESETDIYISEQEAEAIIAAFYDNGNDPRWVSPSDAARLREDLKLLAEENVRLTEKLELERNQKIVSLDDLRHVLTQNGSRTSLGDGA